MTIGCAKRLAERGDEDFVEAIPVHVRQRVREAGMLAWDDAALFVELVESIHARVGQEGAGRFWQAVMAAALDRALLKPLMTGAVGLYGRQPLTLMRFAGKAWGLVSRKCGQMTLEERGEGHALVLRNVPPAIAEHPAFIDVWRGGSLEAIERMQARPRIERPAAFAGSGVELQISIEPTQA